MMKRKSKLLLYMVLFCSVFLYLSAPAFSEKLELSKKELKWRMKLFYPMKQLKGKEFKKIQKLVKKDNIGEALQEAQKFYDSHPDNLQAAYCLQVVKSYSMITEDWSLYGNVTSSLLTFSAWIEMHNGNYDKVIELAQECLARFEKEGLRQQMMLKRFPARSQVPSYWALNDVGTCFYLLGEAFYKKGEYQRSFESFKQISQYFSYAQCYDPSRGFWKANEVAEKKILLLVAKHNISGRSINKVVDIDVYENDREEQKTPREIVRKELEPAIIVRTGNVEITEELITLEDIKQQQQAIEEEPLNTFSRTAQEDILLEDVEMAFDELPVGEHKELGQVKNENDVLHQKTPEKVMQVAEKRKKGELDDIEENYIFEITRKKTELEGINKEIYEEKSEILSLLKQLGEPPIITVTLKEGNEKEALESLRYQKKKMKKRLAEKLKDKYGDI